MDTVDSEEYIPIGHINIDTWALGNLGPKSTGVDAMLWISSFQTGLEPLILVGCDKYCYGSMDFAVSFMNTPKIIAPKDFKISEELWNQITKWIEINRDALIKHWNHEYDTMSCLRNLRKTNKLKVIYNTNMDKFPLTSEERRKYLQWWFSEVSLTNEVDKYLELFPELDTRLCKFGIGIFLWNLTGKIDIENPDDVSRVRIMLKMIDQTPAYDFFDNTFNDDDPDTVSQILGITPMKKAEEEEITFDYYSITALKNYEEAHKHFEGVSWCIVISEESFNEYTASGNRFYVCKNKSWYEIPCIPGKGFPRDRYGYSLIAVEVTPDNKIASITSRWNTFEGDTGNFISEEELRTILGEENYQKLFV